MTGSEKRDILELKRLVKNAASSVAMDTATAGISLTFAEQQSLKYGQPLKYEKRTVAMDSGPSKGARFVTQRHDKRLTVGPVSALEYRHPGQPALDGSDTRSGQEREQAALTGNINDPEQVEEVYGNDSLTEDERRELEQSLTAFEATERSSSGAKRVGLSATNADYARRHGRPVTEVS